MRPCPTGKIRYVTEGAAQADLRAAVRCIRRHKMMHQGVRGKGNRRRAQKEPQRAYRCDRCGNWHLTSQHGEADGD